MSKKSIRSIIFLSILVIFGGANYIHHNVQTEKEQAIVVKNSKSIVYPHSLSVQEKNQVHNQNYLDFLKNQEEQAKKAEEEQKAAGEKQKQSEKQQKQVDEQQKESDSNAQQAQTNNGSTNVVQKETTPANNNAENSSSAAQSSASTPVVTDHSSGFNFGGYHFPIAGFSGSGQVPATQYVYRWTSKSNWYLLEQGGAAGQVVKSSVGIGTAITVDGKTYHVTDIQPGLERTTAATTYMWSHIDQHAIGFQTCDDQTHLTLYFAD